MDDMLKNGANHKTFAKEGQLLSNLLLVSKKNVGSRPIINFEYFQSLFSLQNGGLVFYQGHAERETLHVQSRPEGCLLLHSSSSKTSEIYPFLVGSSIIQIPLSMFWTGTSSSNFYKASKYPNSSSKKNQHSDYHLSGPYALDDPNNRRSECGKGYIDFLLQQLRFIINLKKSEVFANQISEFLEL